MELSNIVINFALFAGMSTEDALKWLPLCKMGKHRIFFALKPGADITSNADRLELAASAIAYYSYSKIITNTGQSVRIGDLSVSQNSSTSQSSPKDLMDEMLNYVSDLLIYNGFIFAQTDTLLENATPPDNPCPPDNPDI